MNSGNRRDGELANMFEPLPFGTVSFAMNYDTKTWRVVVLLSRGIQRMVGEYPTKSAAWNDAISQGLFE